MSYKANIPQATDLISNSQSDLLNNFTSIATTFDVNHVDFNDAGAGKHKKVEIVNDPTVTGVAGQATLFATAEDVWVIKGNGTPYQLTYNPPSNGTTNSYSFLPGYAPGGPYVIQWGRTANAVNGQTIQVNGTTVIYEAFPVIEDAGGGIGGIVNIRSVGSSGGQGSFTINTNGTVTIRWIAIGH